MTKTRRSLSDPDSSLEVKTLRSRDDDSTSFGPFLPLQMKPVLASGSCKLPLLLLSGVLVVGSDPSLISDQCRQLSRDGEDQSR